MSDICPNCQVTHYKHVGNEANWCVDCGTLWTTRSPKYDDIIDIPTCHRAPETKELPDVDDYWWFRPHRERDWIAGRFGPHNHRGKGEYIQLTPPPVPPEPERDPDALMILRLIGAGLTKEDGERIAARLEAKGAK